MCDIWKNFSARFIELWTTEAHPEGLCCPAVYMNAADSSALKATQAAFMQQLLTNALRFGGCVMIRRLLGIAHNADFERIEAAEVRAVCEARALRMGRELLVNCNAYVAIEDVVALARAKQMDGSEPCYPIAPAAAQ